MRHARPALTHHPPPTPPRLDFGSKPIERQLVLSAQFLHNELPVRLAHRVAELENSPYGLSAKPHVLRVRVAGVDRRPRAGRGRRHARTPRPRARAIGELAARVERPGPAAGRSSGLLACIAWLAGRPGFRRVCWMGPAHALPTLAPPNNLLRTPTFKVRDWYVESFKELRAFPRIRNAEDEENFTEMLRHVYFRHRNVVPVLAMGVAGAVSCLLAWGEGGVFTLGVMQLREGRGWGGPPARRPRLCGGRPRRGRGRATTARTGVGPRLTARTPHPVPLRRPPLPPQSSSASWSGRWA